jgi:hypothetical protein
MSDWQEKLKRLGTAAQNAARTTIEANRQASAKAVAPSHVCTRCGHVGKPVYQTSTNGCFAVVLLFRFNV